MRTIKKILKSFRHGIEGVYHAYRVDRSFKLEINIGLPVYLTLAYFLAPLQPTQLILLIGSYLFILIIELINTAFEKMIDKLHPDEHEIIKRSKDIAAGAVLIAFMFATIVVCILAYEHLSLAHHDRGFMLGSAAV